MPQSSIIYAATPTTTTTASTTWYGPLCSVGALLQLETSEAPAQVTFRGTGTLKNFYARGHTNSRGTDSTVNFRVAGASAVSLTIPAGNTASVTDLSSTVALADGNLWNSSITTGTGAGALGVTLSCELQTPGQSFNYLTSFGSASSSTSLRYWCLGGIVSLSATEASVNATALEAFTASNLQIYIRTNPSAAGFDVRFRNGGANGNQLIAAATIGTATGLFEDTSNTDSVASGANYCVSTSAPSSAITVGSISIKRLGSTPGASTLSGNLSSTALAATATRYSSFAGAFGATESQNQLLAPFAGTMSKFSAYVSTNASTTTVTAVVRVAGASVNETLAITASTTGLFQDLTNSDNFTAGQTLGFMASGGTTGSVTIQWVGAFVRGPATKSSMLLLGVG